MSTSRNSFRNTRVVSVIVLGFFTLALAYSVRAGLGLAVPVWEKELLWSRYETSNVAAVALMVMAIVAPLTGYIFDVKGLRSTLVFGMCAVCAACMLTSLASSIPMLFIGFGVIGGIGFGIVSTHIVAAAVALEVAPSRVGFATGIATSGSTAGQFVIVPLIAILLGAYDWRWAFAVLGIGSALLIPIIFLIPNDGSANVRSATNSHARKQTTLFVELRQLFFSPVFHLLFWGYFICGYTTTGVIETHLLPYAQLCGHAPLPSATAYGLLSATNIIGMIGIGWLTDRMNRPLLLCGIYVVRGLTFWLLLHIGSSYEHLLLFAVIFGLVDYSTVPVTTSLVASHLGLRRIGFLMGLLTAGHQIGAATGAGMGGYLYYQHGAYDFVWTSSIALALIAGILSALVRESRPVVK